MPISAYSSTRHENTEISGHVIEDGQGGAGVTFAVQQVMADLKAAGFGATPTDGTFLVGDGTGFGGESGSTARDSIGLGILNSVNFANITTPGDLDVGGDILGFEPAGVLKIVGAPTGGVPYIELYSPSHATRPGWIILSTTSLDGLILDDTLQEARLLSMDFTPGIGSETIGKSSKRWDNGFFDDLDVDGDIVVSGDIELGHASDTTLARSSAGNLTIEGNLVYRAGGTDVPVADGGTGASTEADARTNLGLGTGDRPEFAGLDVGASAGDWKAVIEGTDAGTLSDSDNIIDGDGASDAVLAVINRQNNSDTEAGLVLRTRNSLASAWAIYSKHTGTNYQADLVFRTRTTSSASKERFRINNDGTWHSQTFTVAGLPSAGTANRRAFVTDANATTFASIVAGGGSNNVPVYDDGTNWRIG